MTRGLLSVLLILVLLAGESTHAAEALGRLFFTPAQRSSLDAGKKLKDATAQAPVRRGPAVVTLNGVVVRSDGESTVWVNGQSSNRGTIANFSATPSADPSSAQVKVPGSASRKMRVGQQLDTRTGIVRESFAPRSRKAATTTQSTLDRSSDIGLPGQTGTEAQATKNPEASSPVGQQ